MSATSSEYAALPTSEQANETDSLVDSQPPPALVGDAKIEDDADERAKRRCGDAAPAVVLVCLLLAMLSSMLAAHAAYMHTTAGAAAVCDSGRVDSSLDGPEAAANRTRHPLWATLFADGEEALLRRRYNSTESLPWCGVIGGVESGQWSLTPDSALRFDLLRCRLRRPSLCEAQRCLASRPILVLGDSLSRYQYLSLTHFLAHGAWPDALGGQPGRPSPVVQPEHGTWTDFYRSLDDAYGGRQHCTCFRNDSVTVERFHFYDAASDVAVRFFYYPLESSLRVGLSEAAEEWRWNGSSRLRYTYTAHSHEPRFCASSDHASCWYPPSVPFRPASALLANVGIWERPLTRNASYFRSISRALPSGLPLRAIWRLGTPRQDGGEMAAGANEAQLRAFGDASRWQVLDGFSLVNQSGARRAHWDLWHFRPYVYEQLNAVLLNMLCDEQWRWAGER